MSTPEPPRMRVGHDERESAVRALSEHLAQGRLDPDEYEERATAAHAARTYDDLDRLFQDLPRSPADPATVQLPTPRPAATPDAPYGRDPVSGLPYSDRYKVVAGLLQLFLPFGVGRFYTGHTGIAVAQLLLAFVGIGMLWAFIDGIVLLAGRPTDPAGRPLRP